MGVGSRTALRELHASCQLIKQGDSRPMRSNPKAMDDLNNILKERQHLYAKADLIIDTENKSEDATYNDLKAKINFNIS